MSGGVLRIPASTLYWSVLDPKPLGRKEIAPAERPLLFEADLPVAIEEVQCAFAALPDGRILACGVERARLEEMLGSDPVSAVPDSVPDWAEAGVDPGLLELLSGTLEPRALRRARRRFVLMAAASILLASALAAGAVVAHGNALLRAAAVADERRAELVKASLAGSKSRPGLPDELRLTAELRELRGTRLADAPVATDAAPSLAEVLAAWPDGVSAQVDSLNVGALDASMRGQARSPEALRQVMDALGAEPGWHVGTPQVRVAKDGVAFTITASKEPGKAAQP